MAHAGCEAVVVGMTVVIAAGAAAVGTTAFSA